MKVNSVTSACRSCRYYTPEGRRGGNCQQLGVPVRGVWKACSLALPPFAPSWEGIEEVWLWQKEMLILQEVLPLADAKIQVGQMECHHNSDQATSTELYSVAVRG